MDTEEDVAKLEYIKRHKVHSLFEFLASTILSNKPTDRPALLKKLVDVLSTMHTPEEDNDEGEAYDATQHNMGDGLEVVLLVSGLDGAGKSTIVSACVDEEVDPVQYPTNGFNPTDLTIDGFSLRFIDLGGAKGIRGMWKDYYADVHGVIYVIDSSDKNRLEESLGCLRDMASDPYCSGKPLLCFLNKQDKPDLLGEEDIRKAVTNVVGSTTPVQYHPTCASKSDHPMHIAIKDGLDWLLGYVRKEYEKLAKRIKQQTAAQRKKWEMEMEMKRKKVQAFKEEEEREKAKSGELSAEDEKNLKYIKAHKIHKLFEDMATVLLEKRPDDSISFLRDYLYTMDGAPPPPDPPADSGNKPSYDPTEENREAEGGKSMYSVTLAVYGLDNAGKSTMISGLGGGEIEKETQVTMGFAPSYLRDDKYDIVIYDLGGGARIRDIWKEHYAFIHGMIYVVDSSDPERFAEAKQCLESIVSDERSKGKPILFLANKQDKEGAKSAEEVQKALGVDDSSGYPWRVFPSCALHAEHKDHPPINDGLTWLLGAVADRYTVLCHRIEEQKVIEKQRTLQRRQEKEKRVREWAEERQQQQQQQEQS